MDKPTQLFFLPGALGRPEFWQPAADLLEYPATKIHVTWPGFSGIPADPGIRRIDDLVDRTVAAIDQPSALIAQSMGGIIAVLAALRKPELVTHLVLSVTSGGMDMASLDAEDWRPALRAAHPELPDWFTGYHEDLSPRLPALGMPTLLLWGDADPISPVKVGRRLAALLPQAELHVFSGRGPRSRLRDGGSGGAAHRSSLAGLITGATFLTWVRDCHPLPVRRASGSHPVHHCDLILNIPWRQ